MATNKQRKIKTMIIRRTRLLPGPGNVLVNVGSQVKPDDIIAELPLPGKVRILDVARGLGVHPEDSDAYLVREFGEPLQVDDVIAQHEKVLSRLVRVPVAGRLLDYWDGKVAIETGQDSINLRAGMFGQVDEIIPEYGAVLATRGNLIQGKWGNVLTGSGRIMVTDALMEIDHSTSGLDSIQDLPMLVLGKCLQADILTGIAERGVSGLILGVLAPELIETAQAFTFPVIVLQGFGDLPPDPKILELLKSSDGELASVDAAEPDLISGRLPEVIIPQEVDKAVTQQDVRGKIEAGQRVRVLSGQAQGLSGEVITIARKRTRFESGLAWTSAIILLQDGVTTRVPIQNLEIIH